MNNAVVVHVLKKEFPNLAERVFAKAETLADKIVLFDIGRIGEVVDLFNKVLFNGQANLVFDDDFRKLYDCTDYNGDKVSLSLSYLLDMLIATILKLYSPDTFFDGVITQDTGKAISVVVGDIHRNNRNKRIKRAIFYYRNNIRFKKIVDYIYGQIKERI